MSVMVILILIVLGLCLGSFINAFVWRFHEQSDLRDQRAELLARQGSGTSKKVKDKGTKPATAELDARLKALSITKGRSMCSHCHHELAAGDLIPVLSYLWLRGKCRYCGEPIADTPVAELLTPLLFVVSYLWWPYGFHGGGLLQFAFWLAFLVGFVALAIYDFRWQELPHDIVFALAGLAIVQLLVMFGGFHTGTHALLGAVYGMILICGLFCALYAISPKAPLEETDEAVSSGSQDEVMDYGYGARVYSALFGWVVRDRISQWIGGGDIALGLLLGLLAGGPAKALLLIFLASLLGTIVAVPLLALGRATRDTHLPFGPFLIAAAIIVVLFGGRILSWYTRQVIGA